MIWLLVTEYSFPCVLCFIVSYTHQGHSHIKAVLTPSSAWNWFPQPVAWLAPPFPSGPFPNISFSPSLPWSSIFHILSSLLRICHCIAFYIFNIFILSFVIPSKCKYYQGRDPCFIHHCISSLWSRLSRYLLHWRINEWIVEYINEITSKSFEKTNLVGKKWLQVIKL